MKNRLIISFLLILCILSLGFAIFEKEYIGWIGGLFFVILSGIIYYNDRK